MKKNYLISKSELVQIPTPENFNDLIGKYYLKKLKNGKNCFYKITVVKYLGKEWLITENYQGLKATIILQTSFEGIVRQREFDFDNLPPLYKIKTSDTNILFNVFE